ncbi:MAG TPA: hypothetical protein VMS31_20915 [Pyrinomonadaceae bacterium]|nr:hypothetical protein [Pyrinomonadaceae bacterium]
MRSLLRYGLVAVGTLELLTIGFVTFRARLEQKVQGQTPAQVSGCNATAAPSLTNPCLVISSFRHNGPGGDADEFVEIFNASTVSVTVSSLSTDGNGIGVFVSAGHGFNPQFGEAAKDVASLACQIPGATVIPGRRWFLCVGTAYSLGARGVNSGTTHSTGDMVIGTGTALLGTSNIPDDAGMALLSLGSNISTQCNLLVPGCLTGFKFGSEDAVVLDKVGFDPYGPSSPSNAGVGGYPDNIYPSLAHQYCEGKCLSPVGDASVIPLGPAILCPTSVTQANPLYTIAGPSGQHDTVFPVVDGGFIRQANGTFSSTHKCYGESGQYKIERRRSGQTFTASAGDIHRDSWNSITGTCTASPAPAVCGNADDFILVTPNPASAVGQTLSGISAVKSVLGAAAPHNLSAPRPIGQTQFTQDAFDTCSGAIIPCTPGQLGPRNAQRRYELDPNILGTNNDVFGTLIIRHRFVNSTGFAVTGVRWRIDDISGLCGAQTGVAGTTSQVATQEARNLRLPNASTPAISPVPSCQGEGSDSGAFTALLKAVNHHGEVVFDSSGTARIVWGTVLEDVFTAPAPHPATGALQPFGGGGNSSFVLNSTTVGSATPYVAGAGSSAITNIGDGVSGGTGSFAVPTMSSAATNTIRVAFKFGVVKSGRFKLLLGREIATLATPLP